MGEPQGPGSLEQLATYQPGWNPAGISRPARVIQVQHPHAGAGEELGTESGLAPKMGAGTPLEGMWGLHARTAGREQRSGLGHKCTCCPISPRPKSLPPCLAPRNHGAHTHMLTHTRAHTHAHSPYACAPTQLPHQSPAPENAC